MSFKAYKYLAYTLVIFTFIISLGFKVSAQTANDILVNVSPENPAPGESTNINLDSYSLNLDASKITWKVGGKVVLTGFGKKSYTLTAPNAGAETAVTISVTSGTTSVETKVIIKPTVTVMLWQADDSYVPPFYKGKALPTPDSSIKIVAIPEIKTGANFVNPKNMTYSWRKDFTNDQEASGYGRDSFSYIGDYLDSSNFIEVNATTIDQKYSATASATIPTFQPKLIFYKNNANLGTVFEEAIADGYNIKDKEIIFAAPYFIAPKDIRIPRLVWTWSINGEAIPTDILQKNLLPLQVQSGVSGSSTVKLEIENMDKIFQTASKEINFTF